MPLRMAARVYENWEEIGEKLAAKSKDTGARREVEAEGALMNFAELKHVIEEVKKECEEQLK